MKRTIFAALAVAVSVLPAMAQETVVKVGTARAISVGATLYAIEKGYFKEAGIKLDMDYINSSADVMAMIAQGQYNIVEGGVSAGYFNAVDKNLPLKLVADRTSSPIYHNIMLRPELKDTVKSIKDLKEGKFDPGTQIYDLKSNGVGLSEMKYTKDKVSPETLRKMDAIKADIISGKLKVPESLEELATFLNTPR